MKKKNIKLISYILCFIFTMSISFAFASGDGAEEVIKNISNSILNVLTWFAYAIAMGALLFIGIKYLTSSANDKANLKNLMPTYLIGIGIIICAFTIAQAVANIAGNETAEDIIQVGEQFGVAFEEKTDENAGNQPTEKPIELVYTEKVYRHSSETYNITIVVNYPDGIEIKASNIDDTARVPTISASPLSYGGRTFKRWEYVLYDSNINEESRGTYEGANFPCSLVKTQNKNYQLTAIYE